MNMRLSPSGALAAARAAALLRAFPRSRFPTLCPPLSPVTVSPANTEAGIRLLSPWGEAPNANNTKAVVSNNFFISTLNLSDTKTAENAFTVE